ncbi:MAG TPA: MopE-related protein, partial [Kofleriaceae bacterium]
TGNVAAGGGCDATVHDGHPVYGPCNNGKWVDDGHGALRCDPSQPSAETCDGVDNNCNGVPDDGIAVTGCAASAPGECAHGMTTCSGGKPGCAPGAAVPEVCDGKDNDCDGVADRTSDAQGNAIACSPFDAANPVDIKLDPLSFDGGSPLISFDDGTIDASNALVAGPSLFSVNIPITNGITLDLKITGATIKGTIGANGAISNGKLGGVIDAKTADTIRGLNVAEIGLTPDNSLLDAIFANLLGPLLALPKASDAILKDYPNCRTPDIDVDGDGLEAFCDSNPNDDMKVVDTCIDGDGTVVKDTMNADGTVAHCTQAIGPNGKPRFVDGVSVELNFTTTPVKSLKMP